MKVKFEWNDSPDRIAKKKLGGQPGMLFLAATAARFMDPYVPADTETSSCRVHTLPCQG